ncbi:hypothetical protein IFR05_004119 [Cadophora sp. M221]|nr:hypothetical protein IFR05_004119 [Cadophora sp. M221]
MALQSESIPAAQFQRRFVITGLGGQGKSEICLQVASLIKQKFWGIFWVDVDKPATAERDFIAVAKLLGHAIESVLEALQVLATTHQSWLLILDNADDPNFDYQVYFPPGNHGAVVMTSRVAECRRYSPDAFEALEGLEEEDSKNLLLKAAEVPLESWPTYENQAKEVVSLLGSHTLAIIQAGAYISQGHCQLHQYRKVYQQQRQRLLKYRPKQAQSRYCDVYATFEASADVLEQSQSESASDALCLLEILSTLGSSVLPLQIFEEGWKGCREISQASNQARGVDEFSQDHVSQLPSFIDPKEDEWDPFRLTEASSLLASLSLATRHDLDGGMTLSMHPLTHAWAKDRQDPKCQDTFFELKQSPNELSREFLPLYDLQARSLINLGKSKEAVALLEQVVRIRETMLAETHPDRLASQHELARAYQANGQVGEAVALLEQVVRIRETTLAETHPARLASQHELARAYQANGQVVEAVALLEQVVRIEETTLAETHPDRLASQHELAGAYQANGQVVEAVALLEQVVRIQETTLAETHPARLASQHELARAYQANGQVVGAVALLEQVVRIRETTLAETHPDRLASQHELARAYQANGQVVEAVALLEQVVKIKRLALPMSHPSRVVSENALSYFYNYFNS